MSIWKEIGLAVLKFSQENDNDPNKLYLTKENESSFFLCTTDLPKKWQMGVEIDGIKKTVQAGGNKIRGMNVAWEANEFKVDFE